MNKTTKVPKKLVDAIDNLVNSGHDEGCEDLVVVDRQYFIDLVKVCQKLGLEQIVTHIEDDD